MPRVVVPAHAGRLLGARLRRGRGGLRPRADLPRARSTALAAAELDARFARAGGRGARAAPRRGPPGPRRSRCERSVDVRYVGQNYELEVAWAGDVGRRSARAFQALHRRLYALRDGRRAWSA